MGLPVSPPLAVAFLVLHFQVRSNKKSHAFRDIFQALQPSKITSSFRFQKFLFPWKNVSDYQIWANIGTQWLNRLITDTYSLEPTFSILQRQVFLWDVCGTLTQPSSSQPSSHGCELVILRKKKENACCGWFSPLPGPVKVTPQKSSGGTNIIKVHGVRSPMAPTRHHLAPGRHTGSAPADSTCLGRGCSWVGRSCSTAEL